MSNKIKIDIVSDVVCPWCTIGYKHLEQAIKELGIEDRVEIIWQPFELNPRMPVEGENIDEHIARKYGSNEAQRAESKKNMIALGDEVGFTFDYFDGMVMPNTREAHILLEYAKEFGKQTELNMRLATAFFGERKDISKRDVLQKEVEAVGLNGNEAIAKLDEVEAKENVLAIETNWQMLGVSSVPTIIFNQAGTLNGAQPVSVYKKFLAEL